MLLISSTASEECVLTDLCPHSTLEAKMRYFSSPVANGCNNGDPLLMSQFISCTNVFSSCGHFEDVAKNEDVNSVGIKIGTGMDLSKVDAALLTNAKVVPEIVQKVTPFLGLKGGAAAATLQKANLTLTTEEAHNLTTTILEYETKKLSEEYVESSCSTCIKDFAKLPANVKAAMLSLNNDLNGLKAKNGDLWTAFTNNQWERAAQLIEEVKVPSFKRRAESLLLRALSNTCTNRKTETLFIYGNSNLFYVNEFEALRNYFLNYINETNISFNKINFATATEETFTPLMDHFTGSKQQIYDLVSNSTSLPFIQQTYDMKYAIQRGRELFKYSTANKYIVLVSFRDDGGVFSDKWLDIRQQADHARAEGIKVIGLIEDFSENARSRMIDITGDKENIISNTGAFDDKEFPCSNVTLYSKICSYFNDEVVVPAGNRTYDEHITGYTSPNFYKLEGNSTYNYIISVNPTNEQLFSKVKTHIFISYTNPFPDTLINDYAHMGRNDGEKTMTISADPKNNSTSFPIYVGVYGDDFKYKISFSQCIPGGSCVVGNNDVEPKGPFPVWLIILIVILSFMVILGIVYAIFRFKKSKIAGSADFKRIEDPLMK